MRIERARGVTLPAIDDVREIEATSRFFVDDDGMHLRIWFLDQTDGILSRKPAAFLLSAHCLISMTWGQVLCFETLRAGHLLGRHSEAPVAVLLRLLEMHLDGVADLLEDTYEEIERHWASSEDVGQADPKTQLGDAHRLEGDRHKVHFVLMDMQRVLSGLEREETVPDAEAHRFDAITRDLESLLEHSDFISEKLDIPDEYATQPDEPDR
jgi:magnesium transporter